MIKGSFEDSNMEITISIDKFVDLWDDSYEDDSGYSVAKYKEIGLDVSRIDLDSFVADMMLSILDFDGNEDEDANNEYFENYETEKCFIRKIEDDIIYINGVLNKL